MTASAFAAILALWSIAGIPKLPYWVVFLVFLISLCIAFVRSWNREHDKVALLAREFIFPRLDAARQALSGTTVEFDSEDAELDYYFNKLKGSARGISKELLRELLSLWKQRKRIISENVF